MVKENHISSAVREIPRYRQKNLTTLYNTLGALVEVWNLITQFLILDFRRKINEIFLGGGQFFFSGGGGVTPPSLILNFS